MLFPFRPSEDRIEKLFASAHNASPSSPHLMTVIGGSLGPSPKGFVHDLSRREIGRGRQIFVAVREALQRWEQFDLGWVRVVNTNAKITQGELIAVEAHTGCFWSINFNRVVEVVDTPTRFGFLCTTTAYHMEEGQERFIIDFDPEDGSVSYLIEAVSRPKHILARIGYPISRAMQRRFARDSHSQIQCCVLNH